MLERFVSALGLAAVAQTASFELCERRALAVARMAGLGVAQAVGFGVAQTASFELRKRRAWGWRCGEGEGAGFAVRNFCSAAATFVW